MAKLYNLARMTVASTGTGTITLSDAVAGCLTFALAGVQDGDVVSYGIDDGDAAEVGVGTYTASGTTLTRGAINSTSSDAAIDMTSDAQVFITPNAGDFQQSGWIPANETWVYASADDPTFAFTIAGADKTGKYSPGMRIMWDQSTDLNRYGIITAVAYDSTDTTVTLYGGTDYNMTTDTIANPYYSTHKAPHGFPLDPTKWSVVTSSTAQTIFSTPTAETWYNAENIVCPIGAWNLYYRVPLLAYKATAGVLAVSCTLSTANNSESTAEYTSVILMDISVGGTGQAGAWAAIATLTGQLTLASKTTYYLNAKTTSTGLNSIQIWGGAANGGTTIIRAVCAYL